MKKRCEVAGMRTGLYDRARGKSWSRALVLAVVVVLTGCGEGAKLVQRTDEGGIVTYPYKGTQGYLFTARRREAQALMRETCEGREYTVVREGEAKGRSRIVQDVAGGEIVTERRWGMEFRCK